MYQPKFGADDKSQSESYGFSKYRILGSAEKKDNKTYHEHKDRGKSNQQEYLRREEEKEKLAESTSELFEDLEEKPKDDKELTEEEVPIRAARELFVENIRETKNAPKRKDLSSIEDAIKKAIEDEKKVIIMD